jgi:hypothetical protein
VKSNELNVGRADVRFGVTTGHDPLIAERVGFPARSGSVASPPLKSDLIRDVRGWRARPRARAAGSRLPPCLNPALAVPLVAARRHVGTQSTLCESPAQRQGRRRRPVTRFWSGPEGSRRRGQDPQEGDHQCRSLRRPKWTGGVRDVDDKPLDSRHQAKRGLSSSSPRHDISSSLSAARMALVGNGRKGLPSATSRHSRAA